MEKKNNPIERNEFFSNLQKVIETQSNTIFQLKSLLDNLPGDIYWKDKEGVWLGLNKHCLESLVRMGVINTAQEQEVIGKTDYELFNKQTADAYRLNDQKVLATEQEIIIEENTDLANGELIILHSIKKPLYDAEKNLLGIVGNTIDITRMKIIEQELKDAKERAEEANNAKTEFIANMSHDIRTPLTGVIGLSEMLENTLQNSEQKKDAHLLHGSGKELLHMLNDILDDVRAEHMSESDVHQETFDLHQCIQDLARLERPTIKLKHLDLRIDIDAKVPQYIVNDRKKIHRILLNLLGNAIKFTQSGHITITVKCLDIKGSHVHLEFGVADTGIGIPKDLQSKVFDRFFKITSSYKGLYTGHGLGLHIAQSYVKLLGGHITLHSEEGVGSTFHFDLSCKIGHSNKKTSSSPSFVSSSENPKAIQCSAASHLLLVEDNAIALKVLESIVLKAGCQFKSVVTGEEAFELVKSTPFDLIITDIGLPGISGNEFTRLVRKWESEQHNRPPLPIVGLTGHAQEAAKPECIACGMNEVFSKPVNLVMVQAMLNTFSTHPQSEKNTVVEENNSGKLGVDLPETENELFQLDKFPLFDANHALQQIGNPMLLKDVLNDFISKAMQNDVDQMQQAYAQKDWANVEKLAHKIKGGVSYLGTLRLKYACQYLERYYKAEHRDLLEKLYHQLLEINRQTIETVAQWLKIHS